MEKGFQLAFIDAQVTVMNLHYRILFLLYFLESKHHYDMFFWFQVTTQLMSPHPQHRIVFQVGLSTSSLHFYYCPLLDQTIFRTEEKCL